MRFEITNGEKICSQCGVAKPLECFSLARTKIGLRANCKDCDRLRHERKKYSAEQIKIRNATKAKDIALSKAGKFECTFCHRELEFDKFTKNKFTKTGYSYRCRDCLQAFYKQKVLLSQTPAQITQKKRQVLLHQQGRKECTKCHKVSPCLVLERLKIKGVIEQIVKNAKEHDSTFINLQIRR